MDACTYGLAAVLAFLATIAGYGRWMGGRPRIPHVLAIWLLIAALLGAGVVMSGSAHRLTLAAANFAVYLFISEAFLFVYAGNIGSLSVQIIVAMLEREPTPDAFERTLTTHSAQMFLRIRLDSLLAQGLLVCQDGRYRVTNRGRRWAAAGTLLKNLLGVGAGG